MIETLRYVDPLPDPIKALAEGFRLGGLSLVKYAFGHSFFLDPDGVREMPVMFPDRARSSREHYPGKGRGDDAIWQGRRVRLGDNAKAQTALSRYSGRSLDRGKGYSVRHIWGHPWDPDAFTAGWNLCYMPFWAGMLTEDQHPLPELKSAVQQVSYELYFRRNPVCPRPDFVRNQGVDFRQVLEDQPVLILGRANAASADTRAEPTTSRGSPESIVKRIRAETHSSWINLGKAVASLEGRGDVKFGSVNVERSARSIVKRMRRETGWDLDTLRRFIDTKRSGA